MVAIAHSIIGDRHLAEDAAQQTFATVAVELPRLRNKAKFGQWLTAICRNAARDIARRAEAVHTYREEPATRGELPENDKSEVVKRGLSRLSASAREVIYLRFYDGMSYQQISAVLGISEQAINGRLRRAKNKLAAHLRRDGFGKVRL